MTDEERDKKPAYISYCKQCNGITGASVDTPEYANDTARFVAECIRGGMTIQRKTAADVRTEKWCDCDSASDQPTLFTEAQP
jgi:hypothetical protein